MPVRCESMDRWDCYEVCVQSARHVTAMLRVVHENKPRVLREDFCGTGAIARRWAEEGRRAVGGGGGGIGETAVGVDVDAGAIERARVEAERAGVKGLAKFVCADAVDAPVAKDDACDVVFVGNFSIGYIHERARLVEYLRRSNERLRMGGGGWGGGVFVCDTYGVGGPGGRGAAGAWTEGGFTRTHVSRGREVVRYSWEHRDADALTGMVTNAIHFRVELDGEVVEEMCDAFVYRWRLWSAPELREAMREAGFRETSVWQDVGEHARALGHGREVGESGIACVVGRSAGTFR